MANITLSVPEEIHEEMKKFSEVKWSQVARKAIINKLETLQLAETLAKKSRLTKKDIEVFNKKLKAAATNTFLKS